MVTVYIGIGSNIEPEKNFQAVYLLLQEAFPSIQFSRTFKSEAIGFEGADFHNSVAKFKLHADNSNFTNRLNETIAHLKQIEKQLGRKKGDKKFSPRVIDIDILLFGELVCKEPIELPRGEVVKNAYVLWPLSEIAPKLRHPIENRTYLELWQSYDKKSQSLVAI